MTAMLDAAVMTKPTMYTARGMSKKIGVPVIPGTNTPLTGTLLPRDAYRGIAIAGVMVDPGTSYSRLVQFPDRLGLGKYITEATVDMSWDSITQITMKLEDPDLVFYKSDYFALGTLITFNGIQFIINDVSVDGGSAGLGGVTIKCRSKAIQDIKNQRGTLDIPNASFTDFILHECKAVNTSFYGQATPLQDVVSRLLPTPGSSGEGTETPSSWTTFEKFAQDSGFVVFETNGAIFFGQPTWLFDNFSVANGNIGVFWQSNKSAFPTTHDLQMDEKSILGYENVEYTLATNLFDSNGNAVRGALVTNKALLNNAVERWDRCVTVPEIEVAYDQGPIPNYTVNFDVDLECAWSYWIGRRVIVRGMGMDVEVQPLMITAVNYSLSGTGNCQVTAQTPINPRTTQKAVTVTSGSAVTGQYANSVPAGKYGNRTFDQVQINNAVAIYNACMNYSAKNPSKGVKVNDILMALMTAITETSLTNYSNPDLPNSLQYSSIVAPGAPRGAPWSDHSLGLFQQRDSWGTIKQRMDPTTSTVLFLQRELAIPNRLHMLPGDVCQAVQVSADPGRYQQNIGAATALIQALSANRGGSTGAGGSLDGWKPGHPVGTRLATDFVNIALQMVGRPYLYGANYPNLTSVPTAFDCLPGYERVWTANRGPVAIAEIVAGDRVWSWDEGKMVDKPVAALATTGRKRMMRIHTRSRSLDVSLRHPVMVLRKQARRRDEKGHWLPNEWCVELVRARNLQRGDLLVSGTSVPDLSKPSKPPVLADGTIVNEDIAWLFGQWTGDGCLRRGGIAIAMFDELQRKRLTQVVYDMWGANARPHPTSGMIISSTVVHRVITEAGFGATALYKTVPEFVRSWPQHLLRAYLEGFAEADGHESYVNYHHITYNSASYALLQDVANLHMLMGGRTSNIYTNMRGKPIIINGVKVKNAQPIHAINYYPESTRTHTTLLETFGARRALPDEHFGIERVLGTYDIGVQDAYDIEVQGTHNFIVEGILTGNCSSLVQWAAYQVGVQYPRDTASQWPWIVNHKSSISVAQAAGIRGAVLFRDPFDADAHTAISLGNGNTVQAYDTGIGVIANQTRTSIANQGFNHAALIPGLIYPTVR